MLQNGKGLAFDPAEAETVRVIFELVERGLTSSRIARTLNDKGLERWNGKPWTRRQVAAILGRSQLYREGTLRYGEACGRNESLAVLV